MSTKQIPSFHRLLAGLLVASLVGCAAPGGDGHARGHRDQGGCGMMGSGKTDSACGMQHMNKDAMCSMYRGMRDAPDEQARQAMMDRHMQGMPAEARRRHMDMLRQQCQ